MKSGNVLTLTRAIVYVAAFYLIFQILTRSDELEILSHLPPTSALFSGSSPLAFSGGPNYRADGSSNNYHLPYHLPHLPSPVPAVSGSENGGSVSIFRIILGVVMYPLYLAITLLAIPVPLLLNTLHLVLHILFTILYPVTSTGRLIARTFILGPLAFVGDILSVFYPVYTFVGGVIGLGCVMGLGAGWLGKISMDLLIHGRVSGSKKSSKRNKSGGSSKSRSTKSKSSSSHRKEDRDQDFTHANNSSRQVDASRGKGSARYPIAVETNAIAQKGSSRVPKWDVSPESGHNDETIVTPRQTASRQIHYDSQRSQFEEPFQRDTRSIARSGGRGHQQHSRYEEDYDPDEDYDQLTHLRGEDGRYDDTTIGKATGRKPQVVATRRRTHMLVEK